MTGKRRLILKWTILIVLVGILIVKFALPKADGPAQITTVPNQAAEKQQAKQPDQIAGTANDFAEANQKKEQKETVNGESKPSGSASGSSQSGQNEQAAKGESEVLPVWILFRSSTCIPCVEMQKTMDALQAEFTGKVNFVTVDVNDRANEALLVQFQIRYIPTTYLYDRNKKLNYQYVGALSVENMRSKLQTLVEVK